MSQDFVLALAIDAASTHPNFPVLLVLQMLTRIILEPFIHAVHMFGAGRVIQRSAIAILPHLTAIDLLNKFPFPADNALCPQLAHWRQTIDGDVYM